ncbi:hypothetical protein O181_005860 [Austropuccinia psidii MF-1]|uniref:Integrase catalytic domain-containing protein n=1 Tax=Austropuccinia psidii MF-1 TaxID=1389203 RepID=A0A9Q3BJ74_9BASI|nr:hypothetical protein [Austropuccinia psidii MF-1]
MTIAHKSGNICKNAYGLCRWALENTPENAAWVPQDEHHIESICVTDIGTELCDQVEKEDRTLDLVKTCSWSPNWRKDVAEYFQTCERIPKENRASGKKFGILIQIQEPNSPWEIVHMEWVTALPPGGDKSYNAFLVLVHRYRKTPILLPVYMDDTAMDTAIIIWKKFISHTGLLQNIISDRDPKFTSAL